MYVLEDLWGGKVNLHEKGFPSKQYAKAMQKLANCGEKLLVVLSEEDRKLFEEYVDDQLEVSIIADCTSFIDGFKLGAKIMLDALTEGEMKNIRKS